MHRYGVNLSGRVGALCRDLETLTTAPETADMFLAHTERSVQVETVFIGEGEELAR